MKTRATLIAFLFFAFSCDTTAPPPPPLQHAPVIRLSLAEAGVTEIWLRVEIDDTIQTRNFRLIRDSSVVASTAMFASDTVIVDTGLFPLANHTYRALLLAQGSVLDSTSWLTVQTLDTNRSTWVFERDTLGGGSSSVLSDVCILEGNKAWAAGSISVRDSNGNIDPQRYGAALWDGTRWQLKKLFYTYQGQTFLLETRGVWAFSETDVWFAGGSVWHWDGTTLQFYPLRFTILSGNETVDRLWGTSGNHLYGVGNAGTIVYFNGNTWQKLESGTTLPVLDVWGGIDTTANEEAVFCIASNLVTGFEHKLFRINGITVEEVAESGLAPRLSGLWFKPHRKYVLVGGGIFMKETIGSSQSWRNYQPGLTQYFSGAVRGSSLNNIFVAAERLLFFNGLVWHPMDDQTLGYHINLSVTGDFMVVVGLEGGNALAVRGYRQQ